MKIAHDECGQRRLAARVAIIAAMLAAVDFALLCDTEDENLQITSVAIYEARQVDTEELAGHFLHVQARVTTSTTTAKQLIAARAVPVNLVAKLEIDDSSFEQCGIGGYVRPWGILLPGFSQQAEKDGESIAPLFYAPSGVLSGAEVIVMKMILEEDGLGLEPPLSRASVPWSRDLLNDVGPAQATVESIEQVQSEYGRGLDATQLTQQVRLRISPDLSRVLGWKRSDLHCGPEISDVLVTAGSTDTVVARFPSSVEISTCRWEIRCPALGVKLELDTTDR